MRSTYDERGFLVMQRKGVWVEIDIRAAELAIDLERDIGAVLWFGEVDVLGLHALGGNAQLMVAGLLDVVVAL